MYSQASATEPYVVVAERKRRVNFLWGFLTLAFGAALVRGHLGAESTASRVVVDLILGLLLVGSISAWVWFRRHPARLEISVEAVTFAHRGQTRSVKLARSSGDLYVRRTMLGGTHPLLFLGITGSDEVIPLQMFDLEEIEAASVSRGWRFVEPPRR